MTQDTGPSQPGDPRLQPAGPSAHPENLAPYGSNPYSAGPAWAGAPGSWAQPSPSGRLANSVNAVSIVQVAAGIAILVSLLMSWVDASFGFVDSTGSSTFVSMATGSDGLAQLWLDLVLLGVAVALITALVSLSMRNVARPVSAVAATGFGLAVVGAAYFISFGMTWDFAILSPGPGAYLCLLASVVGGLAAVAHLANPRLGSTRAAPPAYWGGASPWPGATPPGPAYPGARPPWMPQQPGATQQPWTPQQPWAPPPGAAQPPAGPPPPERAWPPQPLTPTYPATAYSTAPDGTAAQLVVLEAGQSRMRSVRPGELLLVGSDPDAQVRLLDPAVQPRHATIERRGNAWVVRDLQTESPLRLMDATGSISPIVGETTVEAGQLLVASVLLTLYRGQG
jgi:hypothetical protein